MRTGRFRFRSLSEKVGVMLTVAQPASKESAGKKPPVNPSANSPVIDVEGPTATLQRRTCPCGGGCPKCLSAAGGAKLQTKLTVNTPGDALELEADRVAEHVMRMPTAPDSCPCGGGCPKCQSKRQTSEALQMKSVDSAAPTGTPASNGTCHSCQAAAAPPMVHQVLHAPGQPLDDTARAFLEPRFGHDFSGVRVHTGAEAEESANRINAVAYTVGNHLVFGRGRYRPGSFEGNSLLAHELTHVLQQQRESSGVSGTVQRQKASGTPEPAASATHGKITKITIWLDRDLVEIHMGAQMLQVSLNYQTPGAVPGRYLYRHASKTWEPRMPWNTSPGAETTTLFSWDGPHPTADQRMEYEIVGGDQGAPVHSVAEAIGTLSPDIRELLVRNGALQPVTAQERQQAYGIVKTIQNMNVTPAEIMDFQIRNPNVRRARDFSQLAEGYRRFFEDIESRRATSGNIELHEIAAEAALAGEEARYEDIRKNPALQLLRAAIGNPGDLADVFERAGNPNDADFLRRVDEWRKLFEAKTLELGRDLLLNLELRLGQDERDFPPEDHESVWKEMTAAMQPVAAPANEAFRASRQFGQKATFKDIFERKPELAYLVEPALRESDRREVRALREQERAEREKAQKKVRDAIPKLRSAQLFADFPFEKLVNLSNFSLVRYEVRIFILSHITAVKEARKELEHNPDWIYKLDNLLAYSKKRQGIEGNPFYEHVIEDRAKAIEAREALIDDLLMFLSIALSLVPGAGAIALAARIGAGVADFAQLGRSIGANVEQNTAYQSGQSSVEPSDAAVWMNLLPFAGRLHGMAKLPGKLIPTAERALGAAGHAGEEAGGHVPAASEGLDLPERQVQEPGPHLTEPPESLEGLSPKQIADPELRQEAKIVEQKVREPQNIQSVLDQNLAKNYDAEIHVGEHEYYHRSDGGGWCRASGQAICGYSFGPEVEEALETTRDARRPSASGKPTERYVEDFLGSQYQTQVQKLEGRAVPKGTKVYGMSIADLASGGARPIVVEVKNIHIGSNIREGFLDLRTQTGNYLSNFLEKTPGNVPALHEPEFWLFLDVRGQELPLGGFNTILDAVHKGTGGVYNHVYFITEHGVLVY